MLAKAEGGCSPLQLTRRNLSGYRLWGFRIRNPRNPLLPKIWACQTWGAVFGSFQEQAVFGCHLGVLHIPSPTNPKKPQDPFPPGPQPQKPQDPLAPGPVVTTRHLDRIESGAAGSLPAALPLPGRLPRDRPRAEFSASAVVLHLYQRRPQADRLVGKPVNTILTNKVPPSFQPSRCVVGWRSGSLKSAPEMVSRNIQNSSLRSSEKEQTCG